MIKGLNFLCRIDGGNTFDVFILLGNVQFTLKDVSNSTTIKFIKKMIKQQEGTPIMRQVLSYNGTQLQDLRSLSDYNIVQHSIIDMNILPIRAKPDIGSFLVNNPNSLLNKFLVLSDEEIKIAEVPNQQLQREMKQNGASPFMTFNFVKEPTEIVFKKNEAEKLVYFLKYIWKLKVNEDFGDMKVLLMREELESLLNESVLKRLYKEFKRYGSKEAPCKVVLRMTKGPTVGPIEFHCDNENATRTVQIALNSTEEYSGGRLCFYVNEQLNILFNRPVGSIVIHPREVLHGVTKLTKGSRFSLFVIDETNGQADLDFLCVTGVEVKAFLSAQQESF